MTNKSVVYSILMLQMLVFTASAEILEFDNNFIEFGPAPIVSLPYPYQAIETVAAPVYTENIVVPAPASTAVEPAGIFSIAISCAFDAAKSVLVFLLTNAPALLAGTAVALGVCKLTPLCDSQVTIYEAQTELRSLATPERLSRAAKFVTEAVKKYREMQNN